MARIFFYSITVSNLRTHDTEKVEEVFLAYGLDPEVSKDEVETYETLHLADGETARAFNEEFCDAIWDALGCYAPIHMASTCLDQFEHVQTFDRSAYAEWAMERNTK